LHSCQERSTFLPDRHRSRQSALIAEKYSVEPLEHTRFLGRSVLPRTLSRYRLRGYYEGMCSWPQLCVTGDTPGSAACCQHNNAQLPTGTSYSTQGACPTKASNKPMRTAHAPAEGLLGSVMKGWGLFDPKATSAA
jgi:hypothetical protein